jgi:hypothetical protein
VFQRAGVPGKIARKGKRGSGDASAESYKGSKKLLHPSLPYSRNSQFANAGMRFKGPLGFFGTQLPELSRHHFQLILWPWKIRNRSDAAAAMTSRSSFTDVEDRFR